MFALLGYLSTILLANWAVVTFGPVPVGFGFVAPAGVYAAGLAFTFRDFVHERYGVIGAILAILVGAGLSCLLSPTLALASGSAFLFSELLDLIVYAPLRQRRWLAAIAVSNVVGLIADSIIFLWIAFGSIDYLAGQVIGKGWMTLITVTSLAVLRRTAPTK